MRKVLLGGVFLSIAFLNPRPAKAIAIAAQLCTGADFLCNASGDVVVDSGIRSNGVGLLGPNTRSQTITLPWGDDFPDPTINFNDPNNPDNFITNTDVPAGFTELDAAVPEPATMVLMGGALCGLALLLRQMKQRKP